MDADWPLFGGDFRVRGVDVCWPRKLVSKIVGGTGAIDVEVAEASRILHSSFRDF